jgi:hypothetical protein
MVPLSAARDPFDRKGIWFLAGAVFLTISWVVVLLAGAAYVTGVLVMGDLYCDETPGSSNYGDIGWSWLPPGQTCEFTQSLPGSQSENITVRGPYPWISIWLVMLLAVASAAVCLYWLTWREHVAAQVTDLVPDSSHPSAGRCARTKWNYAPSPQTRPPTVWAASASDSWIQWA